MYVPYSDDADLLPEEAVELINDYDPNREVVLATVELSGKATCITLAAQPEPTAIYFKRTLIREQHLFVIVKITKAIP